MNFKTTFLCIVQDERYEKNIYRKPITTYENISFSFSAVDFKEAASLLEETKKTIKRQIVSTRLEQNTFVPDFANDCNVLQGTFYGDV